MKRVKIVDISEEDAHFREKAVLIGKTGLLEKRESIDEWDCGRFTFDKPVEFIRGVMFKGCYFHEVKVVEIPWYRHWLSYIGF